MPRKTRKEKMLIDAKRNSFLPSYTFTSTVASKTIPTNVSTFNFIQTDIKKTLIIGASLIVLEVSLSLIFR